MSGINKVILIGNLGKDPDVRYMPNGGAVANLTVATSENWKDKNTGEKQERVEWHRVVMFNRLGEIAGEYLKKGSKVYIEGKLQTRKWQDNDGNDRYSTEIVANEMKMLDSRGGDFQGQQNQGGGYQQSQGGYQQPSQPQGQSQSQPPAQNQSQNQNQGQQPAPASNGFDDFDDDIPF